TRAARRAARAARLGGARADRRHPARGAGGRRARLRRACGPAPAPARAAARGARLRGDRACADRRSGGAHGAGRGARRGPRRAHARRRRRERRGRGDGRRPFLAAFDGARGRGRRGRRRHAPAALLRSGDGARDLRRETDGRSFTVTRHRLHLHALAALAAAALLALAGCGGGGDDNGGGGSSTTSANTDVSGNVSVVGIWTGDEQKSFQAVIDKFNETYPNVKVKYTSAGDNVPTVVSTAVEGGNPPDIATIAQPGLIREFQQKGAARPIDYVRSTLEENYPPDLIDLGEIDGKLYSFVFKGANKSTVWYDVSAFRNAGVEAPRTWDEFLSTGRTLKASGVPAYAI